MEKDLGFLRIHIQRGVNLAVRDLRSSDPYVVVKLGKQKVKTGVVRRNLNPEWNDDLTISISDPNVPIKLHVYDQDTITSDDKMGDAEFDIGPFLQAISMGLEGLPDGTIIKRVRANGQNCLTEDSDIVFSNGKVVQNMVLRLRNVERGEVELQLRWIDNPGSNR